LRIAPVEHTIGGIEEYLEEAFAAVLRFCLEPSQNEAAG
jgi:hypothetical protein